MVEKKGNIIKICHISSVGNPLDGRVFFKQCRSLKKAGYQVVYISKFLETDLIKKSGIEWITLSCPKSRIIRMVWVSFFQVLYYSLKSRVHIYHFHEPEIIPAMIILKIFNKKVVYEIHENYEGSISTKNYIPSKILRKQVARIYSLIEKLCIKIFDGFILARPDLVEKVHGAQNKQVICNFPIYQSISTKKQTLPKGKTNIIYAGYITKIRGILELIQAFIHLNNYQLQLLGWFECPNFQKECSNLPGWKNVRYLGGCNADQVIGYVNDADIGIVNFLPHPNHMTTLATKPFEYMMCGLPMILPNFPYWREFFKDSAVYTNPYDPKSIANTIINLSSDKKLMDEIGHRNLEKVKNKYNWELEFQKIPRFYEKVLSPI